MQAVARLVGEGLGRERGEQAVLIRHVPHGFAVDEMIVGGAQCAGVANAQFLLPVSQLGVILLYADALRFQRRYDVVDCVLGVGHSHAGVVEAVVKGDIAAVVRFARQVPFGLHRRLEC